MHNYNDMHGRLPAAAVCGKDGKPLLSWRVTILPFVDGKGEDLYADFHLDEPWDSPHNIQLLPRMPGSYAPPRYKEDKAPAYHTFIHVFVGKGTAFEGPEGLRIPDDFPDGTSNTILIVEGGQPVPWTKPEEIPYDPNLPLPELATVLRGGFHVGMADGGNRIIFTRKISEQTLRAAITRNDGEKLGQDWAY